MREAQRRPKTSKKYDVGMNATMYAIGPQFDLPQPRHQGQVNRREVPMRAAGGG